MAVNINKRKTQCFNFFQKEKEKLTAGTSRMAGLAAGLAPCYQWSFLAMGSFCALNSVAFITDSGFAYFLLLPVQYKRIEDGYVYLGSKSRRFAIGSVFIPANSREQVWEISCNFQRFHCTEQMEQKLRYE